MYVDYLEQLIQCLKNTRVYDRDGRLFTDYNDAMEELVKLFIDTKKEQKQVFFVGNGGSAAIASHMTADFMKNGGMKTYNLYDHSVTTCMGNDYGYEYIFSRPLDFLGNKGDLLVAISSSGNSPNIVNALEVAQKKELKTITFSGFHNKNSIIDKGIYNIHVPINCYGIVESIHNLILQQVVDVILERDGECI